MKVQSLSQNVLFTGNPAVKQAAKKVTPELKDVYVASKVKLTQVTNGNFVRILRNILGC